MYQQAQSAQGAPGAGPDMSGMGAGPDMGAGAGAGQASGSANDDNVVDADFEVVDDDEQ